MSQAVQSKSRHGKRLRIVNAAVEVFANVRAEAYVEALVQGNATDEEAADLITALAPRLAERAPAALPLRASAVVSARVEIFGRRATVSKRKFNFARQIRSKFCQDSGTVFQKVYEVQLMTLNSLI